MTGGTCASFAPDAVDACVDRIAASRHFSRSPRLTRFLRFVVASIVDGNVDELKERTIGVEVYGRPLEYDPRKDPIVRTEAHRLRTRLAAYYANEGSADPIVIELPRGRYVPELRPSAEDPHHGPEGYRLLVADLDDRSPGAGRAGTGRALAAELRAALARWPGLRVVPGLPGAPTNGAHLEADYRVEGTLERRADSCALTLRIVRLADEKETWSRTERVRGRDVERLHSVCEPLAASIGTALTRRGRPPRPAAARAHDLFVRGRHSAIQYGNTLDPRHLEPARRRLEAALEDEPEYVDALAELAHLELLQLYPPRGDAARALARARGLLARALAAEPAHARSLYLLGHALGSALRPREALRLTESAVAIDPEDPEGRTMLAVRYASLGFWESAVAACDWAQALDPVWDAPLRIKAYLVTRMGELDAACRAVEALARSGCSPAEIAIARFDLRLAEGDFAGAQAALASQDSTFARRPDLEDRREIAHALAGALRGERQDARRTLEDHRRDGPRFWEHTIQLALVLGEEALALEQLRRSPLHRSYRWLASETLARPYLELPGWHALADDLHASWLADLEEVGPRLPAHPPALPRTPR